MHARMVAVIALAVLGGGRGARVQANGPEQDAAAPALDAATAADVAPAPACVTNPQTYLEIINACTDAQAVDKMDDLSPMSLADGGLRPLP